MHTRNIYIYKLLHVIYHIKNKNAESQSNTHHATSESLLSSGVIGERLSSIHAYAQ